MFHEHESFFAPRDKNVKIWRYMDITKFLFTVTNETLYFTRSDKLEDHFEGSYTKQTFLDRNYGEKKYFKWYENLRSKMLINCWHMNEYESDAMWKIFLPTKEGIAIQSTYDRLINSLARDRNYHTQVGIVRYLDYDKEAFPYGHACNAFLTKRINFEHEKELRAITDLSTWNPGTNSHLETVEHGKHIPIYTDLLIENVYISPNSDGWVCELIQQICNKLNLNFSITRSTLNSRPFY